MWKTRHVDKQASPQWPHEIIPLVSDKLPPGTGIDTLIETGTLTGATAIHESAYFSEIHTIELGEDLYQANLVRFRQHPRIHSYQGNSAVVLPKVLAQVRGHCLFFLDAHWSGDSSVDWQLSDWKGYGIDTAHLGKGRTPRPEEQSPLLEELAAIERGYPKPGIILIDDLRVVGKRDVGFVGEDWSHITIDKVLGCFGRRRIRHAEAMKRADQHAQYVIVLGGRCA